MTMTVNESFVDRADVLIGYDQLTPASSRLQTPEEFEAREKPGWLVYKKMPSYGLGRIVGQPAEGKTFVGIDLAMRIARNVPDWFGFDIDQHGDVVYVLTEGSFDSRERVRAWELSHPEYPLIGGQNIYLLPEQDFNMAEEGSVTWLTVDIGLRKIKPKLVVIDTQRNAASGIDENDNTAMGEIVDRMRRFANDLPALVLFVHHPTKKGDSASGAGAVLAKMDFEIHIANGKIEYVKNKFAPVDEKMPYTLQEIELGYVDDKGRPVTSCCVKPGPVASATAKDTLAQLIEDTNLARETFAGSDKALSKSLILGGLFGNHNDPAVLRFEQLIGAGVFQRVGAKYLLVSP